MQNAQPNTLPKHYFRTRFTRYLAEEACRNVEFWLCSEWRLLLYTSHKKTGSWCKKHQEPVEYIHESDV